MILSTADFQNRFPGSIKDVKVGFIKVGKTCKENPTYQQVCTGKSGHVEALFIELVNPSEHFEDLIRFFFTFHDPTEKTDRAVIVEISMGLIFSIPTLSKLRSPAR
jgi:peptide methionine sulfoxide reductase MsrA